MAKKRHESDTIRQQRLANKEFIELKKIERGETVPESSNTSVSDMTAGKKIENFWFYYGKIIIIAIIVIVGIVFSTVQCLNKPRYDLKVIYFTYDLIPESVTEKLADKLEEYCIDTNNDSKILVSVVNCSVDKERTQIEKYQKLQSLIYGDEEAVMFITDDESIKYFDNIRTDKKTFFKEQTATLPGSFFEGTGYTPKAPITLSVRNLKGTDFYKKGEKFVKTADAIIEKLK